jgi:hypothetical protein
MFVYNMGDTDTLAVRQLGSNLWLFTFDLFVVTF